MANLPETPSFDAGVYQLEVTDQARAGAAGILNAPLKALTNRTRWLKTQGDALEAGLGALEAAILLKAPMDLFIGMTVEWNGSVLPDGFLWEDGANYSRTTYAKLYARIGTTHGAGDGVNTFGVPDSRGLVAVGRDDMGGTAANRVTSGVSGLAGTMLGAIGGDQRTQAHTHGISDGGHVHGVNDPGHGHSITDPSHSHTTSSVVNDVVGTDSNYLGTGNFYAPTKASGTDGAVTGISINGSGTSIWLSGSGANITVLSAGGGGAQNLQPSIVKNKIIFTGVFP